MLPQNSLASPVNPGLPLSAAVQNIIPGGSVPNLDQRNVNDISRNLNDPQIFPHFGNAFNLQNQLGGFENALNIQNRFREFAQPEQPEWQEEANRWNRHTEPPLSIERNLPPWLTNTFSDRFRSPFINGFNNLRNDPILDIPFEKRNNEVNHKTISTLTENIEIPSDKDLEHFRDIKNHVPENTDFVSKSRVPQLGNINRQRELLVGPTIPKIDVMQHLDDLSMILDDVFMKQVPKISCSLRLYPLYKRVMVNMVKELFKKVQPNERLFSMLWRDLRICGHFKSSKTDKLVKKLHRYDRKKSKDNSDEKPGSIIPKNVIKKRKYLEKVLSKRYRQFVSTRKPFLRRKSKFRSGSSSHDSSQSEESRSSEESKPRRERYPKSWKRDRSGAKRFSRFKNENKSFGQDSSDQSD